MSPLDAKLISGGAMPPLEADVTPAPTAAADAAGDAAYRARAKQAAEKFESFFIGEIIKQMRRSTRELSGDDAVFKDRVNDDMLHFADGLVADALAGQRAFGVADAILRQLLPPESAPFNEPARAVAKTEKTPPSSPLSPDSP